MPQPNARYVPLDGRTRGHGRLLSTNEPHVVILCGAGHTRRSNACTGLTSRYDLWLVLPGPRHTASVQRGEEAATVAMAMEVPVRWASRRRRGLAFEVVAGAVAIAIVVTQLPHIAYTMSTYSAFWLMLAVSLLAGTQA